MGVILCVKTEHGIFLELGRYASVFAAKSDALEYADLMRHHIDDHGVMVFSISDGNEYESFRVHVESGETW